MRKNPLMEPFEQSHVNRLNQRLNEAHKQEKKSFENRLNPKQKSILNGIEDPVDKLRYIRTREVSS